MNIEAMQRHEVETDAKNRARFWEADLYKRTPGAPDPSSSRKIPTAEKPARKTSPPEAV